jgi:hypothetical protein
LQIIFRDHLFLLNPSNDLSPFVVVDGNSMIGSWASMGTLLALSDGDQAAKSGLSARAAGWQRGQGDGGLQTRFLDQGTGSLPAALRQGASQ